MRVSVLPRFLRPGEWRDTAVGDESSVTQSWEQESALTQGLSNRLISFRAGPLGDWTRSSLCYGHWHQRGNRAASVEEKCCNSTSSMYYISEFSLAVSSRQLCKSNTCMDVSIYHRDMPVCSSCYL